MKNKTVKIISLIMIVVLALAVAGFAVYEVVVKQDTSSIPRAAILLVSLIFSAVRIVMGRGRHGVAPLSVYRKHYEDIVGTAFAGDTKQEKTFLRALEAYATNKPAECLKHLDGLTPSYQSYHDRFAVAFFRALCYDDMKMYPQAIELYEQALQMREHASAASNMGLCHQRLGDYEAAIAAYEKAIAIDPQLAHPYNNVAHLYIRMDDYEKALPFAQKAAELDNKLGAAYSAMAICYAMRGEREPYEKARRQAVLCGSSESDIRYVLQKMNAPIQ